MEQPETVNLSNASDATPVDLALSRGADIARKELHDRWGGIRQGGVAPSSVSPNVFLFADPAANKAHGYRPDKWFASDLFEYCGEGQRGDQSITRYNKSILEAADRGKALQLFFGWRKNVTYAGRFHLDEAEPYFIDNGRDIEGKDRQVIVFRLRPEGFASGVEAKSLSDDGQRTIERTELTGTPYREANESAATTVDREPFSVDPDAQDRGLRAHAYAQNTLATWIKGHGATPLSPAPSDPNFDLAWESGGTRFVAEVKSVVPANEPKQLRLGLGQVLDYAHQLEAKPVLFVDRRPISNRWLEIAAQAGVVLLWPAALAGDRALEALA